MSNEVAIAEQPRALSVKPELTSGHGIAPIIPRTIDEVGRVAKAILTAGLMPYGYEGRTPEETMSKVIIGIMKAAEVGLAPITGLSTIAIINNRPCIFGDGAVALCQRAGQVEWVKQVYEGKHDAEDWTAVYSIKRKGQDEPYIGRFSVAQAKRAHLWMNVKKDPWCKYPERMLMARARAYALRDGFADCLSGLSIAEEVQDLPEPAKAIADTSFLADKPEIAAIEYQPEPQAEVAGGEAVEDPAAEAEIDDSTDWHIVADEIRTELDCAETVAAITDIVESESFQDMKDHCAKETVVAILAHVNKRMEALRGRPHQDEAA